MSNRAIRKYQEARAAEAAAARASDDDVPDDNVDAEAEVGDTTGPVNMFSMLGGEEGPVSSDESDGAEAEVQAQTPKAAAKGKAGGDKPSGDKPSGGKRRRKGKKGKKKTAADDEDWFVGAAAPSVGDDVFALPDAFFSAEDDADLRASAREILRDAIAYPDGIVPGEIEALAVASRALVAVSPVMLSAESELRRLFGSVVVEGDVEGRRSRRRKAGRLVTPRDNWWPTAPGMAMVGDDGAVGEATLEGDDLSAGEGVEVRYFRYRFEKRYDVLQRDFEAIVRSHNPQLLVELVSRAPYHVDTLLQLGEVHRQTGELDRAGELVQRALYVLEATWTRAFKPFNGSCRLRYAVPENRSLFLALFRHVQLLAHRGLHRTALEAGKLYLNLDPPFDPLGALVIIDSLALLSGEFGWVRAMHRDYVPSSLELFPNFVVSAIVAEHCQAEAAGGGKKKKSGSGKKKKKKADDSTEYVPSEKEAEQTPLQKLTGALLSFPMLAVPLLSAAGESTDLCDKYEIFSSEAAAQMDHDGVLVRISRIYAESSKVMWKGSTLMLLKDAIIGAGSAAAGGQGEMGLELAAGAQELREDALNFFRRTKAYDHLQVGDFTGNATNVPAELMAPEDDDYPMAPLGGNHAPAGNFDRREDAGAEFGDGQALPMAPVPQPISRTQAAVAFFRSLMPWHTPEEDLAPPAPVEGLEEGTWDRLQEMFSRQREDADGDAGSGEDA